MADLKNEAPKIDRAFVSRQDRLNKALDTYVTSNKKALDEETNLASFSGFVKRFTEDAKVRGFDMRELNSRIGKTIAQTALAAENEDYLGLLGVIQTSPGTYYANTLEARDLIQNTRNAIMQKQIERENREWQAYQRQQIVLKDSFDIQIGEQRNKLITGELTIDEFEKSVNPIIMDMHSSGEIELAEKNREWIKKRREDGQKPRKVDFGSPQATELAKIAETATNTRELALYQLENNVIISSDLSQALTRIIEYNKSIPYNFVASLEYKELGDNFTKAIDAPAAKNVTQIMTLLEGLSGITRDPTPPKYFVVRAQIEREFQQELANSFREIQMMPGGNPVYDQFTPEQSRLWRETITEKLKERQESDSKRLQSVIDRYNEEVTRDAQVFKESQNELNSFDSVANIIGDPELVTIPASLRASFEYQAENIFETSFFGVPKTELGKYVDDRAKRAGYEGIEDPNAEQLITDIIDAMRKTLKKGRK